MTADALDATLRTTSGIEMIAAHRRHTSSPPSST
jgi:hypothetical protein